MNKDAKIYVAGHRGLVGSALLRQLKARGYHNLVLRTHAELELRDQAAVQAFFVTEKPEYVILAAAKVGGIHANNTYPAEFIHDNLVIQSNVIHSAWQHNVNRLLFLGSSCIYPKDCPQPMKEEYLLTGPLEPTNRPYALAKIAGIEMCHAYNRQYGTKYMAVMPTNLYGPNDNYDLNNSHVLPAMIRKMHLAKLAQQGDYAGITRDESIHGKISDELRATLGLAPESKVRSPGDPVVLWGTGSPKREFLYSEDMADACLYLMEQPESVLSDLFSDERPPLVNIGCGEDLTIRELAETITEIVGYSGKLVFDSTKPDGTMRKLMDVSRLKYFGWVAKTSLRKGIFAAYQSYLAEAK
ncbi:MAG: GDP-fucose synthetase [Gallionellales bacterium 35-53-114]|jgi:GDP-L-fucose synthase|nr:MAG: GDP-fucose synthetase [Gallionellales bacterium 35-53-114]OYZ63471.1 MAG: GDP-fucose synthetase [Gallionellales bacterium 24-53-125]OZB10916.1 MAG: GDP-fucose synthetase [Gallionellales bacterium 39-52-133]HQS58902.1 GDP-L-fucose synthase [Gallionellaceae bacterium]HQS75713.1 GDP-L-fucose synthase [Gallionellaceae bacterium]